MTYCTHFLSQGRTFIYKVVAYFQNIIDIITIVGTVIKTLGMYTVLYIQGPMIKQERQTDGTITAM